VFFSRTSFEVDPDAHGPQENEENKQLTWATDAHAAFKQNAPRPGLVHSRLPHFWVEMVPCKSPRQGLEGTFRCWSAGQRFAYGNAYSSNFRGSCMQVWGVYPFVSRPRLSHTHKGCRISVQEAAAQAAHLSLGKQERRMEKGGRLKVSKVRCELPQIYTSRFVHVILAQGPC